MEYIFREYYDKQGIPPRCCHARDILGKIVDSARFFGIPPVIDAETLERFCSSYFLTDAADFSI